MNSQFFSFSFLSLNLYNLTFVFFFLISYPFFLTSSNYSNTFYDMHPPNFYRGIVTCDYVFFFLLHDCHVTRKVKKNGCFYVNGLKK